MKTTSKRSHTTNITALTAMWCSEAQQTWAVSEVCLNTDSIPKVCATFNQRSIRDILCTAWVKRRCFQSPQEPFSQHIQLERCPSLNTAAAAASSFRCGSILDTVLCVCCLTHYAAHGSGSAFWSALQPGNPEVKKTFSFLGVFQSSSRHCVM